MDIVWIIALAILAGIIPAALARGLGRSFLAWWVYGTFLFPVALAHVLYSRFSVGMKVCPYCHTRVKYTAAHCTRCGYEFIEF
ncbi:MAG: zinc ribbon domain-containing protein [Deltaproteobacteria bacterium]|nr:zinc ribbon domain-containing protein [Deltaproteobacteria bacterium]